MKPFNLTNDPKIESGFAVPNHYFDQLESVIMNKLPHPATKTIPIYKNRKVWYWSAAAIFTLSMGIIMYLNANQTNNFTSEDYLAYDHNISTEDIAVHLSDNDIAEIEKSLDLYHEETKAYVENYLY